MSLYNEYTFEYFIHEYMFKRLIYIYVFDLYGHFGNGHHTFCSCCVLIVCCICVYVGLVALYYVTLV